VDQRTYTSIYDSHVGDEMENRRASTFFQELGKLYQTARCHAPWRQRT